MPVVERVPAFLRMIDPPRRGYFEKRLRAFHVRKNQTIVEHDSRSTDVYFLLEGEARVLLYSPDGREVSVRILRPGEIFGELAAIDGLPRSATVVAVEPSQLIAMKTRRFSGLHRNVTQGGGLACTPFRKPDPGADGQDFRAQRAKRAQPPAL
jgi:CRP-like cAMP-binding protein